MADEDPQYLVRVWSLPCAACRARPPVVTGHHPTQWRETGHDARRAHDWLAIPLCWRCHSALHDLAGVFKGWSGEALCAWEWLVVLATRFRLSLPAPSPEVCPW